MRPSFHPRLINDPFDDPGLFIPFQFQHRAVIFDLGDITCLAAKDILKISHVFVSHTHMDHFIGFDRLLRLSLGREKNLWLYGPPGFLKNVEGKLDGYTWNLADKYNYPLSLQISEVHPRYTLCRQYRCRDRFQPLRDPVELPFAGILYEEPAFRVSAVILDHKIPCLGFSIRERFHVNIITDGLKALGLTPGSWLTEFKQALYSQADPASKFEVKFDRQKPAKHFTVGALADKIARITPGQKISYITDVVYSAVNSEKIVEVARGSDHLFIEAAFLDQDFELANRKHHLTARQAGHLAGTAQVKQMTVFHFSPRYTGMEEQLLEEARAAYERSFGQTAEGFDFGIRNGECGVK
jgi:ribonuclease Z